jgi:chaperonin cofactor prefoldin
VIVAAPDEEVVIKAKKPAPPAGPKAPKGAPKMVIRHKQGEDSMERRMARLEQMVERLAEREQRLERFEGDFQRPELGKLQEDIERAARDADLAMRRFHRAGKGKDFVFEHKFALEGDVKMQRKALEAQRKAMEKHLEAIDKQLEKLDAAGQDAEVDTDVDVESDESKASPPPDSAP